jgi:hypothetical protein
MSLFLLSQRPLYLVPLFFLEREMRERGVRRVHHEPATEKLLRHRAPRHAFFCTIFPIPP